MTDEEKAISEKYIDRLEIELKDRSSYDILSVLKEKLFIDYIMNVEDRRGTTDDEIMKHFSEVSVVIRRLKKKNYHKAIPNPTDEDIERCRQTRSDLMEDLKDKSSGTIMASALVAMSEYMIDNVRDFETEQHTVVSRFLLIFNIVAERLRLQEKNDD